MEGRSSRRGFGAAVLGALFGRGPIKGQSLTSLASLAPARCISRTYRADAVVLLLGFPIYRLAGVGGGQASLEETGDGQSSQQTLFFAAGSDPERAHGFSRVGWMREVVLGPMGAPTEATYFGVLTSSPEESLEHARAAVTAPPSGRSLFRAVSGRNIAGHSRSAVTNFEFASGAMWSDRGLIDHAQSTFQSHVDWRETCWPKSPTQAPPTFLCEVAKLLEQRARRAAGRYVYDEQEYLLELETTAAGHDHLVPVRGKIRNLRTGHETVFRVWLDGASNSVVPVRIEFQPRSFLRLTFEAVAA